MEVILIICSCILAYLFGSIPTGYLLVKRFCKVDVRTKGSGNIGSTNVKRVAGSKISAATQCVDIVKGIIPVFIAIIIYNNCAINISKETYLSLVALSAIFGHNFTPFLGFNGGKGVNTTLGAFVLISPIAVFSGVAVYFILRPFTSIVSIRSLSLGLAIPMVSIIVQRPLPIIIAAFIAWVVMIIRHKSNLIRLIKKEEK